MNKLNEKILKDNKLTVGIYLRRYKNNNESKKKNFLFYFNNSYFFYSFLIKIINFYKF